MSLREECVTILNAALRTVLLLVEGLDDGVAHITLNVVVPRCVLPLNLIVHLNEVFLTLLLLVLLHELFDHLLSVLLALLPYVLLDQFVDAANLLLLRWWKLRGISSTWDTCGVIGPYGSVLTSSDQALALAFATFTLLRPLLALLVMLTDDERFHETIKLALVRLS